MGNALQPVRTFEFFQAGERAAQNNRQNALNEQTQIQQNALAQQQGKRDQIAQSLELIGRAMAGVNDAETYESRLNDLEGLGIDVKPFRGKPQMANIAASLAISTIDRVKFARDDAEAEQEANQFSQTLELKAAEFGQGQSNKDRDFVQKQVNFDARFAQDQEKVDISRDRVNQPNVTISAPKDMMIDPNNPGSFVPIPGSELERKRAESVRKKEVGANAQRTTSNIVSQDIDRAIAIIENEGVRLPVTGFGAETSSEIAGTDAFQVDKLLETVKANAGFDKLQKMREASPTGGALGQVSERELSFLQATIGNLAQGQRKEDLIFNLERIRAAYSIVADIGLEEAERQGLVVDGQVVLESSSLSSQNDPDGIRGLLFQ